jgi:hypothetical protein
VSVVSPPNYEQILRDISDFVLGEHDLRKRQIAIEMMKHASTLIELDAKYPPCPACGQPAARRQVKS